MSSALDRKNEDLRVSRSHKPSWEELSEMTASEYLKKYYNIVLPPKIAEFWNGAAYIEENGEIVFENPDQEPISGYWDNSNKTPYFDYELEKYLSWYLFDNDPRYGIIPCRPGMVCEINEDGHGYLEFEVYDRENREYLFVGRVIGHASWKEEGDETFVEFVPIAIALEPLS